MLRATSSQGKDTQQAKGCQLSAVLCASPICPDQNPAVPVKQRNGQLECTMDVGCPSEGESKVDEQHD
jgi:hypothetical protein